MSTVLLLISYKYSWNTDGNCPLSGKAIEDNNCLTHVTMTFFIIVNNLILTILTVFKIQDINGEEGTRQEKEQILRR